MHSTYLYALVACLGALPWSLVEWARTYRLVAGRLRCSSNGTLQPPCFRSSSSVSPGYVSIFYDMQRKPCMHRTLESCALHTLKLLAGASASLQAAAAPAGDHAAVPISPRTRAASQPSPASQQPAPSQAAQLEASQQQTEQSSQQQCGQSSQQQTTQPLAEEQIAAATGTQRQPP